MQIRLVTATRRRVEVFRVYVRDTLVGEYPTLRKARQVIRCLERKMVTNPTRTV